MKINYDLKNKNLNHIVYNSICFANWKHNCTGIPETELSGREFILVTMSFDRNSDETWVPSENPNIKKNNYNIQFYFSTNNRIYFRAFDWNSQKYFEWKTVL